MLIPELVIKSSYNAYMKTEVLHPQHSKMKTTCLLSVILKNRSSSNLKPQKYFKFRNKYFCFHKNYKRRKSSTIMVTKSVLYLKISCLNYKSNQ